MKLAAGTASKYAETFWVLTAFTVLTMLFFWPVLPHLKTSLIGLPEDNMQFYWFLWYGVKSLFDPTLAFFHTDLMFYPEGTGLHFANYFYFGIAAAALLQKWMSLTLIYNLLVLLPFVIGGWGAYRLIKDLTGDRAASAWGAFVFVFSPFHLMHAQGHPTVASIQFIPFFLHFLIRAHRTGGWRDRTGAALMLALSAYCDWNYLAYCGLLLPMAFVLAAYQQKTLWPVRAAVNLAAIGAGALLLVAPVMVPMIRFAMRNPMISELGGSDTYVADLLSFVLPNRKHPLGSVDWIVMLNRRMTGAMGERSVFLGWVNLALVLSAAGSILARRKKYLIGFAFFAVLALGVNLHVAGKVWSLPMPYEYFEKLPFLKNARNPSRTMAVGYLFWAILTGFAVQAFAARVRRGRAGIAALTTVLLLGFFDFYIPCAWATPVRLPAVYGPILKDPGYPTREFAVFSYPWYYGRYSMYQTLHGIPDVQGYIGRRFNASLLDRLSMKDLYAQRAMLRQNKVKYMIIYKKRITWKLGNSFEEKCRIEMTKVADAYGGFYPKVYDDEDAAAFRVY